MAVYNERARNNGLAYFKSSTAGVRASVVKRFNNEKLDALKSLEQEIKQASNPVQGQANEVTLPVGPQ